MSTGEEKVGRVRTKDGGGQVRQSMEHIKDRSTENEGKKIICSDPDEQKVMSHAASREDTYMLLLLNEQRERGTQELV